MRRQIAVDPGVEQRDVPTFCPLCVSKCGAIATVAVDTLVQLRPDPSHPTGSAICVKGKAAPEIVAHRDRLLYPIRRTAPKGAADPGWQRISWDEALDEVAARLNEIKRDSGAEAVLFGSSSPSTSAMSDTVDWLMRLKNAFGSPNLSAAMELCGWGRYFASAFTFGAPLPGLFMPELEQAGCILFWGYNPSVSRLAHATSTTAALRRGAKLVVVDPRAVGLAARADSWLRVRPGTDAALALALTHVLIENDWFDADFVREWTNAPFLMRVDTGELVRSGADGYVAWDAARGAAVTYDPAAGYEVDASSLALRGTFEVPTDDGPVRCRPVFDVMAEKCAAMSPAIAEDVTGVPAAQIESTARLLWESRPLAMYTWSGLEQHSNTTQTIRAICQLYALIGSLDAPGGNVSLPAVAANRIDGFELLSREQAAKAIGLEQRPLSAARAGFVTGPDFYTAALEGVPYRLRALVNFGANFVMAHGDSARGRDALSVLDFFVHSDLFMSPTAELADIVLPVTSAFESEALRVGFEMDAASQSLVQLRAPLVPPRGEARSDIQIVFALATRLGLSEQFFGGDVDAAWRHQLEPSGISLEDLRAKPEGIRVPLTTEYRKFAEVREGAVRGLPTPSRKVELFSEAFARHGYAPLPEFTEPAISPRSRPDLAERFPLVLTCTKSLRYCETQHRQIESLRSAAPDPVVEVHPSTAASRGIGADDWVLIETPKGSVRARAKLDAKLEPNVVCGQHGWWQAADELGLGGFPPYGPDSANLNLVLGQTPSDPISGTSPLRSSLCEISLVR
ncbi:MAG TPA: molybdopterin-dependent oxidoreductase [Jatrophihabitantaceae bacterium]|nr:molybdopterin-dependent oxidoreductase [Jatrophihabitantaceae bacterium]